MPALAAGGSLPGLARPSNGRRVRLVVELGLLFIAAPLALVIAIQTFRVSLFLVLAPVLIGFVFYLLHDRTGRYFFTGVSMF